jgi:hydroxyacylglutathione hydrolase
MFFHEITDPDARSTYVLGYGSEAIVIDPGHDVASYLEVARMEGARVRYVLETESRVAYAAARDTLAERAGAVALGPGGAKGAGDALKLRSGHTLRLGPVQIIPFAPPGQGSGHLAYAICDLSRSSEAVAIIGGVIEHRPVLA